MELYGHSGHIPLAQLFAKKLIQDQKKSKQPKDKEVLAEVHAVLGYAHMWLGSDSEALW